jgi:hypothetical protein
VSTSPPHGVLEHSPARKDNCRRDTIWQSFCLICHRMDTVSTDNSYARLGALGRNDTYATPMPGRSGAESLRTSFSSKVSTCQNC